jgi:hypothetical protein
MVLPVARPGREELEALVALGQALRLARAHRLHIELAEALEDHLLAVGRHGREAGHAGGEVVRRDRDLWMQRIDQAAAVADPKRDHRAVAAVGVHAPDLAARPEDDRLVVRRPGHVRIEAGDRPGLLNVLVERIEHLALHA